LASTGAASLYIIPNIPFKPGTEADDFFGWSVASAGDFDGDGQPDYVVSAPNGNIESNTTAGFVMLFHSSDGPVAALVRNWKAHWHSADIVDLGFEFSVLAEEVVDLRLTRRTHDSDGTPLSESLIWSGSASPADDEVVGILVRRENGFGYRDDLSGIGAEVVLISYTVDLVTNTGLEMRAENMSGPGERRMAFPAKLALAPAWPNPANPAVTIRFLASYDQNVTVTILDVRGRIVRRLHQGVGQNKWQDVLWDGLTDAGQAAASGVYLIRVQSGTELATERVVLAR